MEDWLNSMMYEELEKQIQEEDDRKFREREIKFEDQEQSQKNEKEERPLL